MIDLDEYFDDDGDLTDDGEALIELGVAVRDAFGDDPTIRIRTLLRRAGLISASVSDPWRALADGLEGIDT